MDYIIKVWCYVSLKIILCEVGHWLWFLVGDTWLSKVMSLCLVITLVELMRIHEYLSCLLWYYLLLFMLVMLFFNYRVVVDYGSKYDVHITWFTFNEHVLLLGMACLTIHKAFKKVKLHGLTKCSFLEWFYLICAYGLIHSTSGILTPFLPFSLKF